MDGDAVLLEHFRAPRNAGRPATDSGQWSSGRAENPACGDVVELFVRIAVSGDGARCVEQARFLCQGCSAAIGGASLVAETIAAMPLDRVRALTADDVIAAIGPVRPTRRHGIDMALRAAKDALARSA